MTAMGINPHDERLLQIKNNKKTGTQYPKTQKNNGQSATTHTHVTRAAAVAALSGAVPVY